MLTIYIEGSEVWDESKEIILDVKPITLHLEHSLLSISKWEQKWKKSFTHTTSLSREEFIDYIRCMTLDKNIEPIYYLSITNKHIDEISAYINDPMTATIIKKTPGPVKKQVITNEVLYASMVEYGIPFSCEKWHLNRLLTLIQVCAENRKQPTKKNKRDIINDYEALNRKRRAMMHSNG